MTIMDFATALTSVTKAVEVLRAMQHIDKNFDAATYKVQIADLMLALADAKQSIVDARDELTEKQNEIDRLKATFRQRKESTVVVRGFRFEERDGKPIGMPYCKRCDTVDGLLIRLVNTRGKGGGKTMCPQCEADHGWELGYNYPNQ